jgi:hypothetical protein
LPFPSQAPGCSAIQWLTPTYTKIHRVLTNPVYAGAYVYGKTRQERYIDDHGAVRQRLKRLPPGEWSVLIHDHHPGFIDWATFEANQVRLASNTRPTPHDSAGALREGAALLQGLALWSLRAQALGGLQWSQRRTDLLLSRGQHRQRQG